MTSVNLPTYLQARADGSTPEQACALSGIGMGEAKLHEADIERGELVLPPASRAGARVHVHEGDQSNGEKTMAKSNVAADELRLLIERIERLKEEIKGLNDDVSDVFKEAKSRGFDTATMKRVIKLRTMETHTIQEADSLLTTYLEALGMGGYEQPLGIAA